MKQTEYIQVFNNINDLIFEDYIFRKIVELLNRYPIKPSKKS